MKKLAENTEKYESLEVQPKSLLQSICEAVADPRMDPVKMAQLYDLHERIVKDQRKVAFMAAMARLQAVLPQMEKHGQAKNSKFSRLEDIDRIVRPLLAAEGFSLSFDEESSAEKTVTFVAVLSHSEGHSEAKRLTVPVDVASKNKDGNSIRPAIQDAGSTVTYARRYLLKMHLNIVETLEDTDGEVRTLITKDEALDLQAQVEASGMNPDKFLVYMKAGKFSDILKSDWDKGQTVIRAAIAEKAAKQ